MIHLNFNNYFLFLLFRNKNQKFLFFVVSYLGIIFVLFLYYSCICRIHPKTKYLFTITTSDFCSSQWKIFFSYCCLIKKTTFAEKRFHKPIGSSSNSSNIIFSLAPTLLIWTDQASASVDFGHVTISKRSDRSNSHTAKLNSRGTHFFLYHFVIISA